MLEHVKEYVIAVVTIVVIVGMTLLLFSSENIAGQAIANQNVREINVENGQFNPASIEILAGDKVVWYNLENRSHNIVQVGCEDCVINSRDFDDRFEQTFVRVGQVQYISQTDGSMLGVINVLNNENFVCEQGDDLCLNETFGNLNKHVVEAHDVSKLITKLQVNRDIDVSFWVHITLYDLNNQVLYQSKQKYSPLSIGDVLISSPFYDENLVKKKTAIVYDVLDPQVWKVYLNESFEVVYR